MDPIKQWRKTCPTPPGEIPYGPFVHKQDGLVYSIDMFRPRFPILWQRLCCSDAAGNPLPVNDENLLRAFRDLLFGCFDEHPEYFDGDGRLNGNLHWWSFHGVRVTLHKFIPFSGSRIGNLSVREPNYSCLMEFNPNKCLDNPVILPLIRRLKEICGPMFCWYNTRIDFTVDIPRPIKDVRLLTRKVGSSFNGTYYFGTRGSSGYTRVYDKRREMKDHYRVDIGREVTRVEYELRSGIPATLDPPYLLAPDLGRYEVLRYVAMADMIPAIRTYHTDTAAKIKKTCFEEVPFDASIFEGLRTDLFRYLELDPADCMDRVAKDRLDAAAAEQEASELERLMAALRRFSGSYD